MPKRRRNKADGDFIDSFLDVPPDIFSEEPRKGGEDCPCGIGWVSFG